jgi:hypothetical protein
MSTNLLMAAFAAGERLAAWAPQTPLGADQRVTTWAGQERPELRVQFAAGWAVRAIAGARLSPLRVRPVGTGGRTLETMVRGWDRGVHWTAWAIEPAPYGPVHAESVTMPDGTIWHRTGQHHLTREVLYAPWDPSRTRVELDLAATELGLGLFDGRPALPPDLPPRLPVRQPRRRPALVVPLRQMPTALTHRPAGGAR